MQEIDSMYRYARQEIINQGTLLEIPTLTLNLVAFRYPVAMTKDIYDLYLAWSDENDVCPTPQNFYARLIAMLTAATAAINNNDSCEEVPFKLQLTPTALKTGINRRKSFKRFFFKLDVIPNDGFSQNYETVALKVICERGERDEPVITILSPDEDYELLLTEEPDTDEMSAIYPYVNARRF